MDEVADTLSTTKSPWLASVAKPRKTTLLNTVSGSTVVRFDTEIEPIVRVETTNLS